MCSSVADGNDLDAISKAIEAAKAVTDKPSIIAVRTVIGYGSPIAGTNKVHGEALKPEEAIETKENLGWPADKFFYVPEEAQKNWSTIMERGAKYEAGVECALCRVQEQIPGAGGRV